MASGVTITFLAASKLRLAMPSKNCRLKLRGHIFRRPMPLPVFTIFELLLVFITYEIVAV